MASDIAHRFGEGMFKSAGRVTDMLHGELDADRSSSDGSTVRRGAVTGNNSCSQVSRFNG